MNNIAYDENGHGPVKKIEWKGKKALKIKNAGVPKTVAVDWTSN